MRRCSMPLDEGHGLFVAVPRDPLDQTPHEKASLSSPWPTQLEQDGIVEACEKRDVVCIGQADDGGLGQCFLPGEEA